MNFVTPPERCCHDSGGGFHPVVVREVLQNRRPIPSKTCIRENPDANFPQENVVLLDARIGIIATNLAEWI
jgi:hypothetical protein